jgi:hypothetical protein
MRAKREIVLVMAGLSRSKNGVASARLCPAIHVLTDLRKVVDARVKPTAVRLKI